DLVMAQIEAHRLSPDDMHTALQQTYASLKALQAQEDANGLVAGEAPKTPPERVNWKKSITNCVFRSKVATDSVRNLPPIPREGCHGFRLKAATDSGRNLPPLQGYWSTTRRRPNPIGIVR